MLFIALFIVRCLFNVVSRLCIGLFPFLLYNHPVKTNISRNDGWKTKNPSKMVPFQGTCSFFWGGRYIACLALAVFWNFLQVC